MFALSVSWRERQAPNDLDGLASMNAEPIQYFHTQWKPALRVT